MNSIETTRVEVTRIVTISGIKSIKSELEFLKVSGNFCKELEAKARMAHAVIAGKSKSSSILAQTF